MPEYIINTDELAAKLLSLPEAARSSYAMNSLRDLHTEKRMEPWAKKLVPAYTEKKGASIGGYSPAFLQFWEAYPPRNGTRTGKAPAMKAWKKVKGITEAELLKVCLASLEWQKQDESWVKDNGTFIPMATTYINQRRWEDEGNTPDDWEEYTDMNGAAKRRRKK
jgi:hypothetical protein